MTIRQGDHIYWSAERSVAVDSESNYCVVWSDSRNGSQNVYARLYDSDDNPLWPEGGIQVTDHRAAQHDPLVMAQPGGDWIIAWRDFRNDTDNEELAELYLQRLTAEGLPIWEEGGVAVTAPDHYADAIYLLPGIDDDVVVLFASNYGRQLIAQGVNENGVSLWVESILYNTEINFINCISDDSGGAFILTYDSTSIQPDCCLYINRLDSEGEMVFGMGNAGICLTQDGCCYRESKLVSDGDGGAIVIWHYDNEELELWGQHISHTGELIWQEGGALLATTDHYLCCIGFDLTASAAGEVAFAWKELGDTYHSDRIKAQRVLSAATNPLFPWGDGITVESDIYLLWNCTILADNSGGTLIGCHMRMNEEDFSTVTYQRFDQDGNQLWSDAVPLDPNASLYDGVAPFVQGDRLKIPSKLSLPDIGGIYLEQYDITNGNDLTPGLGSPVVEGIEGDTRNPVIIHSASSAYVGWRDTRPLNSSLPYMQRIDMTTGQVQWQDHGISILPGWITGTEQSNRYTTDNLTLHPDGTGGAIALFDFRVRTDSTDSGTYHLLQRLSPTGAALWGPQGLPFISDTTAGYSAIEKGHLMTTGDGGALLFYQVDNPAGQCEVRKQLYQADGTPLWGEWGEISFLPVQDDYWLVEAVELPDNRYMLIGQIQQEYEVWQVVAMLVNGNGEPFWDESVLLIDLDEPCYVYSRSITIVDNRLVFLMCAYPFSESRLQCMDLDGTLLWTPSGVELEIEGFSYQVAVIHSTNGNFWFGVSSHESVEMQLYRTDDYTAVLDEPVVFGNIGGYIREPRYVADLIGGVYAIWNTSEVYVDKDFRYLHLTADGAFAHPDYGQEGIPLVTALYQQEHLSAVPDGEGGVLTCWNDFRGRRGDTVEDDVYAMRINDWASESIVMRNAPVGWQLGAAYPNPFNPVTSINFNVPHPADVQLGVYNILGQQVAVLAEGMHTAGLHRVTFDTNAGTGPLSSGIYIYRLEGDGISLVRKMMLLK